jgi:hypothetical protein
MSDSDRYRVALASDQAEVALWLNNRLGTTHVRWDAGQFTWTEARDFAAWATKTIRPKVEGHRWTAVPVSPDEPEDQATRDRVREHYADVAAELRG